MNQLGRNQDAFVDVIANTLGILIILVFLPIVLNFISQELDYSELERAKEEDRRAEQRLQVLDRDTMMARGRQRALESAREKWRRKSAEARAGLERVQRELEEADRIGADRAQVLRQLPEQERKARAQYVAARKAAEPSIQKYPPSDVVRARKETPEQLRARLRALFAEAVSLKKKGAIRVHRNRALAERAESVKVHLRRFIQEMRYLAGLGYAWIEVREPPARRRPVPLNPIWVKCYHPNASVDIDGIPRPTVRLMQASEPGAPVQTAPVGPEESTLQILARDSAFRRFLFESDEEYRHGHRLRIRVGSGGALAYRIASDLAREAGWTVAGEPVE